MADCVEKNCWFLSLVNNEFAVPLISYWHGSRWVLRRPAWRERLSSALVSYLINPSKTTLDANLLLRQYPLGDTWSRFHQLSIEHVALASSLDKSSYRQIKLRSLHSHWSLNYSYRCWYYHLITGNDTTGKWDTRKIQGANSITILQMQCHECLFVVFESTIH